MDAADAPVAALLVGGFSGNEGGWVPSGITGRTPALGGIDAAVGVTRSPVPLPVTVPSRPRLLAAPLLVRVMAGRTL